MAKTKKRSAPSSNLDTAYLLKLILYVIIGAQWLRLNHAGSQIPLPIGLLIGVLFASHEQFKIDRKIEFAVLVVAMLVGYFSQSGLSLNI